LPAIHRGRKVIIKGKVLISDCCRKSRMALPHGAEKPELVVYEKPYKPEFVRSIVLKPPTIGNASFQARESRSPS